MRHVYTIEDLRNWPDATRDVNPPIRLGVFGDPVEHSLSPEMQNAALRSSEIVMQYARFRIRPNELKEALERVSALRFIGLNVTVPHKQMVMPLLDHADKTAEGSGSVNTLLLRGGRIIGFSTDGSGFADAIASECNNADLADFNVLILGAGGAARAIGAECVRSECAKVFICNRTRATANDLAARLVSLANETSVEAIDQNRHAIARALQKANLIVNATTVGMNSADDALIDEDLFSATQFVYDTIYARDETALLRSARLSGARVANGLSMLLYQGARAFQIWFDREAPLEVMRHALST